MKSIAKTELFTNFKEDGFVWKSGGYTVAETKKRAPAQLCGTKEKDPDSGMFKLTG